MSTEARRSERTRDAVSLVLLLAGIVAYAIAYRKMTMLAGGNITIQPGETAFDQWARYHYLSRAAMGLVVSGIAIGVWSFWSRGRHRAGRLT
ncbi:MAG: hypothetical protein WKG32_01045 [Gemmatimonadaceae bacterium]